MKFKLLSDKDIKAIDLLKESYGGAKEIVKTVEKMRDFETRKKILAHKQEYGKMIEHAEKLVKQFPKISNFERENNISYNNNFGIATSQVSGFQGARVTYHCMKKIANSVNTDEPVFIPCEMISVVPLTEEYVYNGNLMATLTMAESIMKASKFCCANLIGTPLPEHRFERIEKITGKNFERVSLGNDLSQLVLKNQGTFFGNFGGIEVGNDNHLVYLDGVIRAAMATGANFFLNPSWSTVVAACYFGRDIPNINIKISMLLSAQNAMQFRMILNIINEYLRDDMTSPIYEINLGNALSAETFIQCAKELKQSNIKGVTLSAHIRINPDLGIANFNWTDNAFKVLEEGTNLTFKYESDGTSRDFDTMAAYFLPEEDRIANAEKIGDVIYYKSLQASKDGKKMMKKGIKVRFGKESY
jgi:hypothetical protein